MYTSLLTLTLALATSTPITALSIQSRSTTVAQGTQSCKAKDSGNAITYTVFIGSPFDGDFCHTIQHTINSELGLSKQDIKSGTGTIEWRDCDSHASGQNYKLLFEYQHNHGAEINKALHGLFPSINGFNCPHH
ncbi:hypothetical protein Tdes44962_MAKER07813 [Teratosphaeria destructans]|uniref:AA1-like domain-containing protein n=1 Tax=Teratosphaeria destructans TaxID=418781 RepID=A0A9W7W5G8_9PEZI|nr:hypothetical protein Tdes44962_MAKER07813 [Teratosphaeria destructans]